METKQSRKGYKKMLWIMWFLAVALLVAIAYVFPGIWGTLKETYLAEYDNIYVSQEAECYLVRDESVIYAENAGDISYYYEEGTRVRKGTAVLEVGSKVYTEPETGTIGYYIDGQEEYFNPDRISEMKQFEVDVMDLEAENVVAETAEEGQPLYKTIAGNYWYLVFWCDKETVVNYNKESSVSVVMGNSKITARITDIIEQAEQYLVVLKTSRYYEDYTKVRKIDAEVVTVDEQGLRLKAQSLVTIDGQPGVYVKQINGTYKFTPVKIYMISGEDVLVAKDSYNVTTEEGTTRVTTVSVYDEILTNGSSAPDTEEKNE